MRESEYVYHEDTKTHIRRAASILNGITNIAEYLEDKALVASCIITRTYTIDKKKPIVYTFIPNLSRGMVDAVITPYIEQLDNPLGVSWRGWLEDDEELPIYHFLIYLDEPDVQILTEWGMGINEQFNTGGMRDIVAEVLYRYDANMWNVPK